MAGERVMLALEAWRETYALRMLGHCYRLCYLLFTETRLVELETDRLVERVPRSESYYVKPHGTSDGPTDLLVNLLGTMAYNLLIDALYERLGEKEKLGEKEEVLSALSGDRLEDVVRLLRNYVGPRMRFTRLVEAFSAPYTGLEKATVRVRGEGVRIEVRASGKKRKYELTFSDGERARYAAERIRALALPNVEVL